MVCFSVASLRLLIGEIRLHVPVDVPGSREHRGKYAHRRTLGIGAHDAGNAYARADIRTAGDDRLHGLAGTRGAEAFQHQIVLLEDAGVLAQRRRLVLPIVDLADCELELVLRLRRRNGRRERGNEGDRTGELAPHRVLPFFRLFVVFRLRDDVVRELPALTDAARRRALEAAGARRPCRGVASSTPRSGWSRWASH